MKGLPRLVRRKRSIAASEYDTFAPKRTVSRKAHTPGKGDEDPMPDAASSGAQPAAKFSSSPGAQPGIIDGSQELRRCEHGGSVALVEHARQFRLARQAGEKFAV